MGLGVLGQHFPPWESRLFSQQPPRPEKASVSSLVVQSGLACSLSKGTVNRGGWEQGMMCQWNGLWWTEAVVRVASRLPSSIYWELQ